MKTFNIYIGSNNRTGVCEFKKIENIFSANHEGFTIYHANGYWHGVKESSAVVVVSDNEARVKSTIAILKRKLNQEAIAYQVAPALRFV